MYCGNCGTHLDQDTLFCPQCGKRASRGEENFSKNLQKNGRNMGKIITAILVVVFLITIAVVAAGDFIAERKKPPVAENPDYTDPVSFNNQLRSTWNYAVTYVNDEHRIYFSDQSYIYTFDPQEGLVNFVLQENAQRKTMGFIWDEQLYSVDGPVYSYTKEGYAFSSFWQLGFLKEENHNYLFNQVLPYDEGYFAIMNSELIYCEWQEAQLFSEEPTYVTYAVDSIEVVFNQVDVSFYGVYRDRLIVVGSDGSIWSVGLKDRSSVCLFAPQIYDSIPAVYGDYVYHVNKTTGYLERASLDGKEITSELFYVGDDVLMDYNYTIAEGVFYYVSESLTGMNGQYSINQVRVDDWSDPVVLASGEMCGVDEWISGLHIMGDWVYYGSQSRGFWRVGMDGSGLEKLADFDSTTL